MDLGIQLAADAILQICPPCHTFAAALTALTSSQLASVVWALAVLKLVEHPVFKSAWQQLLARGMTPDLGTRQLMQVWQSHMALQLEGSSAAAKLAQEAGE